MIFKAEFRRTKIVATIGPATNSPEAIRQLIEAGVSTFRLNFSHGTHADHHRNICSIRQISSELNQPVGILQDLQGPKIRLGKFDCGSIFLENGDKFILTSRRVECTHEISSVTYEGLAEEVPLGATIMLDDGKVELRVEQIDRENQDLHCVTVIGGVLSDSKGVNFPNVHLSVSALTDKDREDLRFGLSEGVDWVALSFVCSPEDVLELKELIAKWGRKSVSVIAKIEKHEAIAQMQEILAVCDGVMVARGDLGVEIPAEDVPLVQKKLISNANQLGIPVITATQMLDSMVSSPRPTRAEISDVANAILDGTDAVMLSNETAVGKYPIKAVQTMARIAMRIEKEHRLEPTDNIGCSVPSAISQAVSKIANQLHASAILTLTRTGATARNVSKYRPPVPIIAVTSHVDIARQLQLVWGVRPLMVLSLPSARQNFTAALNVAQEKKLLAAGDLVVMTAGTLQGVAGSTDLIKVEIVSAIVGTGLSIGYGMVSGRARVAHHYLDVQDFHPGEILVVNRTDADFIGIIRKAAAIITEEPSLDSHAVVIGRRLGIPVLAGVSDATIKVRDGETLTVDFPRGIVRSGSPVESQTKQYH
ncbi:pyruvate kinase [Thalassoporum mexicanum PCC 7367]|uniref:pyruvate kinase n=1 Tax=Thalassoporum mexicanum TaxID=3457544 RepID=UPI00029FA4CD|nr:pyruvate kinase [Pseudanabaena sp. PCC 7367]AFY70441.1 pyruvate kinase [Pseudanabaena sp. PCC 7367]